MSEQKSGTIEDEIVVTPPDDSGATVVEPETASIPVVEETPAVKKSLFPKIVGISMLLIAVLCVVGLILIPKSAPVATTASSGSGGSWSFFSTPDLSAKAAAKLAAAGTPVSPTTGTTPAIAPSADLAVMSMSAARDVWNQKHGPNAGYWIRCSIAGCNLGGGHTVNPHNAYDALIAENAVVTLRIYQNYQQFQISQKTVEVTIIPRGQFTDLERMLEHQIETNTLDWYNPSVQPGGDFVVTYPVGEKSYLSAYNGMPASSRLGMMNCKPLVEFVRNKAYLAKKDGIISALNPVQAVTNLIMARKSNQAGSANIRYYVRYRNDGRDLELRLGITGRGAKTRTFKNVHFSTCTVK